MSSPDQGLAQQQQIYRNAMEPQFQKDSDQRMGQVVAGLGHRLQGTFGQLTANQQALNEGLAHADLEKQIYDSGQTAVNQNIDRATSLGSLLSNIQTMHQMPYMSLGQLLSPTGNNVSNYNQANSANYGTQMGYLGQKYAADASKQAAMWNAAGQIGGAATTALLL